MVCEQPASSKLDLNLVKFLKADSSEEQKDRERNIKTETEVGRREGGRGGEGERERERERERESEMMMMITIITTTMIALKGAIRYCFISPYCGENCLQHVPSSDQDTFVCKSRATRRAFITCNLLCACGTKGQLSY